MVSETKDSYWTKSPNGEAEVLESQQNNNPEKTKEITNNSYNILPAEQIWNIDFWYASDKPKNQRLVSHLNNSAEWNDSIEWRLAQNEQIQLLLSEVLSDYKNYISTDKENLKTLINQENAIIKNEAQTEMIESMYEYMLTNDNESEFENFIMTRSINTIKMYLSSHTDENWKFSFISKNEIKARLKIDWFINLYKWYREKHTENSEALGKLEQELKQFNNVASYVKNSIDDWIKQYLWWEYDKKELAEYLKNFLTKLKENEKLKGLIGSKDKNSIIWVIRYGIKEYARLLNISDDNPQLGESSDWDKVFDMQIRSYLYLYWLIAHSDKFTPEKWLDDNELWEILKWILKSDWVIKDDWKDERGYMESEKKLREEQVKQDIKRRRNARLSINPMQNKEQKSGWLWLKKLENSGIDIQNATWVEIVKDKNLWDQIVCFYRKEKKSEMEDMAIQRGVLMQTWITFTEKYKEILNNYLENREDVKKFFFVWKYWPSFNSKEWGNFKDQRIKNHPENDALELDNLKNTLLNFISEYEENVRKTWNFIDEKKDQAHETIRDYALGAVIDNIKDMFQNIIDTNNTWNFMNWFEFDEKESVRVENNCLLLSGKFNWETMNIKYDLNTWKLYMNSFINESSGRITIWSTKPDYEVWELKPFENILDDFYNSPTNSINNNVLSVTGNSYVSKKSNENTSWYQQEAQKSPPKAIHNISEIRRKIKEEHKIKFQKMCWTKLDEIWWKIKYEVETKNTQISVTSDLLKTLGVVPEYEQWDGKSINFTWWDNPSDLYKIVQLITTQKNTIEELYTFSNYMKTFMGYIWLNWWKNSNHQDKTREVSKIIFDENNKQDCISYIRENTKYFSREYGMAQTANQFNGENFWILRIISEKFTSGDYPNRKLDSNKIKLFENGLEHDILAARDAAYANNLLEENNLV